MTSTATKRDLSKFHAHTPALDVVAGVDLAGRVAIVTGGASGIGVETARALAAAGAHVIIAARDAAAADNAVKDIIKSTGNSKVDAMSVELGDLKSIASFAAAFKARKLPLHILVNNAGVMACPESKTKDGFETQFGVNHLGHFFLTTLLLDVLIASKPARVVNVSSSGHQLSDICWDDVNLTKAYDPWKAYGQSKTANILFANELARRYASQGVAANSCHPGLIQTKLARHMTPKDWEAIAKNMPHIDFKDPDLHKTPAEGASTQVLLATAPELEGKAGLYFEDCQPAKPRPAEETRGLMNLQAAHTKDVSAGKRLWKLSLQLLKAHYDAKLFESLNADV